MHIMAQQSIKIDSEFVTRERMKRLLSQIQFAKKVGIAPNTLANAERGEGVSFTTIRLLAEYIGCGADVLVLTDEEVAS